MEMRAYRKVACALDIAPEATIGQLVEQHRLPPKQVIWCW
jgi:hypothetical protein